MTNEEGRVITTETIDDVYRDGDGGGAGFMIGHRKGERHKETRRRAQLISENKSDEVPPIVITLPNGNMKHDG